MERIRIGGQPSGRCSLFCSKIVKELGQQPLEQLIDTAKELGFELVRMDVAEICDDSHEIYESPVIYLRHIRRWEKAVISQKEFGSGVVFSLHYCMQGE